MLKYLYKFWTLVSAVLIVCTFTANATIWMEGKQLTHEGLGWSRTGNNGYARLPDKANGVVTTDVWSRSRTSA